MSVVGVVGLGAMGTGIAQCYAAAGLEVIATDAVAATRAGARDRWARALGERVAAGKLAPEAMEATLARLTVADGLEALAPCTLVVEAIVEELAAKRTLLHALEAVLAPHAVLATNTSSLRVGDLAAGLAHPGRLLALHFFNPPVAMRLVELAPHAGTDATSRATARALTERAGKVVVECPDRPGFIVNRCARPYYGEALALLGEGRAAAEIDAAMVGAGYRLGPFALIDLVGADVHLAATRGVAAAMGGHPRYHVFPALEAQVTSGHLGRKTGRGFVFPDPPAAAPPDAADLVRRIEATMVNEAHVLLAEGGVTREGIDTAMRLGLNFPRGPFEALAVHGREAVLATLAALRAAAPAALADRYLPAPLLVSP